jgi:hypothetical protein
VLLAAAFVSYAGPFNATLRRQLVAERWLPDIVARGIPISAGETLGGGLIHAALADQMRKNRNHCVECAI